MNRFNNFLNALNEKNNIEVKFKDESKLMKILGWVLFFNSNFSKNFVTTIGSTVYYPSRDWIKNHHDASIKLLAHELVHIKDNKKFSFLFGFLYLFPLSLLPLSFSCYLFMPFWAAALISLFCLLPFPAPWRMHFELKAYKMSLFVNDLFLREKGLSSTDRYIELCDQAREMNKYFTGPFYYFMWPFGVKKKLKDEAYLIINSSTLESSDIYFEVKEAFEKSNSVI